VHRHFALPQSVMTKPSVSALTSGLVEQQTRKLIYLIWEPGLVYFTFAQRNSKWARGKWQPRATRIEPRPTRIGLPNSPFFFVLSLAKLGQVGERRPNLIFIYVFTLFFLTMVFLANTVEFRVFGESR